MKMTLNLYIVIFSVLGNLAHAEQKPEVHIQPTIQWQDQSQREIKMDLEVTSGWVWTRPVVRELQRPVYRLRVDFPAGYEVKILQRTRSRAEISPLPGAEKRVSLVADTISPQSELALQIIDGQKIKKRVSVLVKLHSTQTTLWTHHSCEQNGFQLTPQHQEGRRPILYLATVCQKNQEKLNVTLLWSGEADSTEVRALLPENVTVYKPSRKPLRNGDDGRNTAWMNFTVPTENVRQPASFSWQPRRLRPSWDWHGGLGVANFNHSEGAAGVRAEQTSVFASVGVTHVLRDEVLDFKGNFEISLFNLRSAVSVGEASSDPARYYQGEVSYGYIMPREAWPMGFPQIRIFAGAQVAGMIVPRAYYGVKFMMGPLLGLQLQTEVGAKRSQAEMHFLIAPVSEKIITVQLQSHKFRIGGSYELTSPTSDKPISVFTDLEWTAMTFEDKNKGFQAFTPKLGLRWGF